MQQSASRIVSFNTGRRDFGWQKWCGNNTKLMMAGIPAETLLLLYNMYVSCHRPFLPGTSLEPAVIPTAQASSFTLQYFPYYV